MHVESHKLTALRRVAGLRYLAPADLATLADVASDVAVPAGSVVQHAGPAEASLAVVVDGTASVWRANRRVGEVGPGQFLSNCPPVDVPIRGARVVAQTPMRMLALPVDLTARLLDDTAIAATMLDGLRRTCVS